MTQLSPTFPPQVAPLRDPATVMRLSRMGAFHQCRLSFMRQLTRRMAREAWRIARATWEINDQGVGRAVYTVDTGPRTYALVAFAHDLPDDQRSDRVIATAWDATFALHDGVPTSADLDRLHANVPLQEAGRISNRELSLSRANRSARLWEHVVDALARGQQPDADRLAETGYLMRTTAVYGSGKFGAADRGLIADRPELAAPFQAEMLAVYLIRLFTLDLAEHMAQAKGGDKAVRLDPALAQSLGIGNSTGLGMAPFLVNHPVLLNNWITARETALARVRALPHATATQRATFDTVLQGAVRTAAAWATSDPQQAAAVAALRADMAALSDWVAQGGLEADHPWDALLDWSATALSLEGQEAVASLVLEPHAALVDDLGEQMSAPDTVLPRFDASMTVAEARALLEPTFGWTTDLDWADPQAQARVWYVSAEKLEPRLGERADEPLEPYEQPLAPARAAAEALQVLRNLPQDQPLWQVLEDAPHLRAALTRAQRCAKAPYGEIHDNTLAHDMRPVDMLRAKLSFFGATRFDPRSDRWLRICMFAGAPYPQRLSTQNADFWVYPGAAA